MGNGNRVKVAGVKLAEGKVRPLEEPPGGGVPWRCAVLGYRCPDRTCLQHR